MVSSVAMKTLLQHYESRGEFMMVDTYQDRDGIRHYQLEFTESWDDYHYDYVIEDVFVLFENGEMKVVVNWVK